jgi:predicted small metal-binding protein
MPLTLTCRRCDITLRADTEDELTQLARDHARHHGHSTTMTHDKILARIRRHNPTQKRHNPDSPSE